MTRPVDLLLVHMNRIMIGYIIHLLYLIDAAKTGLLSENLSIEES